MKRRVLFLCTGNSARSQMAEALLQHQADGHFDVFSAGTHPEGVDARAVEALERFNIDVKNLRSKPVSEFIGDKFDFVITLCNKAKQECEKFLNAAESIAWDFSDPKTRGGLKPFDTTLKELNERIKMFVLVQTKKGTTAS